MDREHALGERRLHVLGIGVLRQLEASLELALEPLAEPERLLLLFLRLQALTLDSQVRSETSITSSFSAKPGTSSSTTNSSSVS